jgi:glycosyltransferase involved in cell wall biosynthesis
MICTPDATIALNVEGKSGLCRSQMPSTYCVVEDVVRIWLISPHDAVPGDSWGQRHVTSLAQTLAARGHEVVYWAASFSHAMKQQRGHGWQEIPVQPGVRVILVPTRSYDKNLGLGRMGAFADYARGLWQRGKAESRPDVLITTVGTPFTDGVSVRLSRLHKAHLITELRDLWPDIFALAFPKPLHALANVLLLPLYLERRFALQNSNAFAAVCQTYLRYAQSAAPNVRRIPTRVMYHSGIRVAQFREKMQCTEFDTEIPAKMPGELWAIYAGTLGNNYDVPALIGAAKILSHMPEAHQIKIVVAGDGPFRSILTEAAAQNGLQNLVYVGVLDMPRLCRYYAKSDIALSIYAKGSTVAIPGKAYDFYAAELPIVNSLRGEFADYLHENDIGLPYEAGNPFSLVQAVLALAGDEPRRAAMILRMRKIAPLFDRDRQYGQIFDLLPGNIS